MRLGRWVSAALAAVVWVQPALGQLRVVTYNTNQGPRTGSDVVLEAIGDEAVNGIAKPIDVLLLQEQTSTTSTTAAYVNLLNGIYGPGTYAAGTLNAQTRGGGRPTLIYNTQTVDLLGEVALGTIFGANDPPRQTVRYELRPIGYDSPDAVFYAYNSHYKAGSSSSDQAERSIEAGVIRADADALGADANVIYAGDFNVRSSSETSFQTLLAAGPGQAFDPINRLGSWNNNNAFKDIHTQSPVTSSRFGGQVTGGMDDRFDFQLTTGELLDGDGLDFIPGSYRAFGNNGTHRLNGEITGGTGAAPAVLEALAQASDHLPVVADFQVPAALSLSVGAAPARVIQGAQTSVPVTVSNTADAVAEAGADVLTYTLTLSGDLPDGPIHGSDAALGGGEVTELALDTQAPGTRGGVVVAQATSRAAANPLAVEEVVFDVLAHAQPSLTADTASALRTIDLGVLSPLAAQRSLAIPLFNLEAVAGFTAGLDLDGVSVSGSGALTLGAVSDQVIAAGASGSFELLLDQATPGQISATATVSVSDEDLPGALALGDLTVQLTAVIADLVGDLTGDGFVGAGDLDVLLGAWNASAPAGGLLSADLNGDGFVGAGDLDLLLGNWNASLGEAATVVPEPATLGVLFGLGIAQLRRRR